MENAKRDVQKRKTKRRFVFKQKLVKANIPAKPMVQIKLENVDINRLPIINNSGSQLRQIAPKPNKSMVVYMCNRCNIYFPIRRMLELHDKSTHPIAPARKKYQDYYKDSGGAFKCRRCSFSSKTSSSMSSHVRLRHAAFIKDEGQDDLELSKRIRAEKTIVIEERKQNEDEDEDDENSWAVETLDENLPVLAKIKEKKDKDPLKLAIMRKCPFCPFSSDNPSTHRSHVKRKHYESWLKSQGKEALEGDSNPEKQPAQPNQSQTEKPVVAKKVSKLRSCPHCSFETMKKSTLYSHINRTHRGVRQGKLFKQMLGKIGRRHCNAFAVTGYACSYCTFAGSTVSSMRCHVAREHGDQKQPIIEFPVDEFDCDQCDYKSKSRKSMQHHAKSTHVMTANEEGLFTCHICSYESLSRMGVQRHISVKHDRQRREAKAGAETKVFICENCDYHSCNAKILDWHKKQHDPEAHAEDNGSALYCNDCEFATWTKDLLITHIKRKHREDEGGVANERKIVEMEGAERVTENHFVCDLCDYTSKNKHVMKVHVIRKHSNDYNFQCELCAKKYKVKADLTNHMRFQHREQPIICDVCGKTCRNSNLLYLHQKFAHYKPEFECHICHRRMVSQANLDEHILKQHEQRQDVICEECGKTFTRQSRLKIHMKTHLGLKPCKCHICGKSFARKNGLRQHLLIHTGQRPYICDICGKDFTQKTGLISHRKSHPGSHPPLPRVYIDHVLSSLTKGDKL